MKLKAFFLSFSVFLFLSSNLMSQSLTDEIITTVPEIHGSLDLSYFDFGKNGDAEGKWKKSSFDIYEYYFGLSMELSSRIDFFSEVRYEHGGDLIELRQGYIYLKNNDYANITFGKFYVPIGTYFRIYYPSLKKFISYAIPMRQIIVAPWQDVGIKIDGKTSISNIEINYALALVNGLNQNYATTKPRDARQNRDNNNNRTLGGRFGVLPLNNLELGVSYAFGKYDDNDLYNYAIMDSDLFFTWKKLEIRGEYALSKTERIAKNTLEREGYYLHAFYKILENINFIKYLETGIRYDTLDPDKNIDDNNDLSRISFGTNIRFTERLLLKTEYQTIKEKKDPQLDNDGFLAQIVIDF